MITGARHASEFLAGLHGNGDTLERRIVSGLRQHPHLRYLAPPRLDEFAHGITPVHKDRPFILVAPATSVSAAAAHIDA
jgi:hypothetical protein